MKPLSLHSVKKKMIDTDTMSPEPWMGNVWQRYMSGSLMTYKVQLLNLQLFLIMLQPKHLMWQYLKLQKVHHHYRLPFCLDQLSFSLSTFLKDYRRILEEIPKGFGKDSKRIPTEFPNKFQKGIFKRYSKRISEKIPERIPERITERIPEIIP